MGSQSVKRIILIIVIFLLGAGLYYIGKPYLTEQNGDSIKKQISVSTFNNQREILFLKINDAQVGMEIVLDESERALGLSGRYELMDNEGMLFVFEQPGFYKMWMKSMYFPIDILWLDKNFTVVDIKKNVDPSTYPQSFAPSSKALYVVELNAGASDKYAIKVGDMWKLADVKVSI